jgi:hypothetical protein
MPTAGLVQESLEITPLSSCSSVDDILAILRARATETVQVHRQSFISTDLSEILHEIRTSCSEASRSDVPMLNERRKVEDLIKRISMESSRGEEDDDPLAVIARIKKRLGSDNHDVKKSYSLVQDSVFLQTSVPKLSSATNEIANIPQLIGPVRQCTGLQTVATPRANDLSIVSVPVEQCIWSQEEDNRYIKSLPLDPNWRRHIEYEIGRMRESINRKINAK